VARRRLAGRAVGRVGARVRVDGGRGPRRAALHRLPLPLRGDLPPPPGGAGGRACPGQAESGLMVPPAWYVGLSGLLFTIGVIGVLVRRNPLVIFMSIELML